MTGGADLHIGNAVHLHRWSLTGTGGAYQIAPKMFRSGLRPADQCRRRRSPAGPDDARHLPKLSRKGVSTAFP
jgi:hypothetical protein